MGPEGPAHRPQRTPWAWRAGPGPGARWLLRLTTETDRSFAGAAMVAPRPGRQQGTLGRALRRSSKSARPLQVEVGAQFALATGHRPRGGDARRGVPCISSHSSLTQASWGTAEWQVRRLKGLPSRSPAEAEAGLPPADRKGTSGDGPAPGACRFRSPVSADP